MLVLANEMFDSPPVFAWVLPVFVRLHVFFTSKRRQMKGPGGKGQGKPGRGKGKDKDKGQG